MRISRIRLVQRWVRYAMSYVMHYMRRRERVALQEPSEENFYRTPLGKAKKKGQQIKKQGKPGKKSKHSPHCDDPTQLSEEAFCQARQRMPLAFWTALLTLLAEQFQRDHRQHRDFHGFRLLAVDGTTLTLHNDERLRRH